MEKADYTCLKEFLFQSIFIPEGEKVPPREILNNPDIFLYIKDFGSKNGDIGVVSVQKGQIIGAVWTRVIPVYDHIDEDTSEIVISILPEFRGYGVGTKLMNKIFEVLKRSGYKKSSLLVQKNNPAVRFYLRLGYEIKNQKKDSAGNEDYIGHLEKLV